MGEIADEHINRMIDGGYGYPSPRRRRAGSLVSDPLYYHTKVEFVRMTMTTEKAVRLELPQGIEIWVPRSVCREWGEGVVWVHTKTLLKSMQTGTKVVAPEAFMSGRDEPRAGIPDDLSMLLDDEDRPF